MKNKTAKKKKKEIIIPVDFPEPLFRWLQDVSKLSGVKMNSVIVVLLAAKLSRFDFTESKK
jgi:hypothetical protein